MGISARLVLCTCAIRVSGVSVYIGVGLQACYLEDESSIGLRRLRQRYVESRGGLFVFQWFTAENCNGAHRAGRPTLWQGIDRDLSSRSFSHHNRVQGVSLHGEVDVIFAFFLEPGPCMRVVDCLAIGSQPFADGQESILLILRDRPVCPWRNVEQQRAVLADGIYQPADHSLGRISLEALHVPPTCRPDRPVDYPRPTADSIRWPAFEIND